MGWNKKTITEQLKHLKTQAEAAFPNVKIALVLIDEDEVHGTRYHALYLPKKWDAGDYINENTENAAFFMPGIINTKQSPLRALFGQNKPTAPIYVDLRKFTNDTKLELEFWRCVSIILDMTAYITMLTLQKAALPAFSSVKKFNMNDKSSLRTDLFAALTLAFDQQSDVPIKDLLKSRAMAPFNRLSMEQCDHHPMVIAHDAVLFAFETTSETLDRIKPWKSARRLAIDITKGFDEHAFIGWRDFAQPARDMSLRGYPVSTILSGALAVNDKPHIRSVAHNCAILLGHDGILDDPEDLEYNAFDSDQSNLIRHEQYAKKLFERSLYEAKKKSCPAPLHEEANRQNLRLTQGQMTGWCADSLQQAAEKFEHLMQGDTPPHVDDLPKPSDFQKDNTQQYSQWSGLKKIAQQVLKSKASGKATSLSALRDHNGDDASLKDIIGAISKTMTNPLYLSKLAAANNAPVRPQPAFKTAPQIKPMTAAHPSNPQPVPVPTPFGTVMETPQTQNAPQGNDE